MTLLRERFERLLTQVVVAHRHHEACKKVVQAHQEAMLEAQAAQSRAWDQVWPLKEELQAALALLEKEVSNER